MIFIIFISLAIVFFFIQYFENKRRERNDAYHEKRQDAFHNLLESLRNKEERQEQSNNKENEP